MFFEILTDFGNLAVLLPLVAVVTAWLIALRQTFVLWWWLVALVLCMVSTAILKVYFFICPPITDLHSPSGHTSLSVLVYGAVTLAVAAAANGWRRAAVAAAGAFFIVGIAISRVVVRAHSVPEVVLGLIIGIAALMLFARQFWRYRPSKLRLRPLLVVCVVLMVLLNGQDLRAEDLLHRIGIYLGSRVCL